MVPLIDSQNLASWSHHSHLQDLIRRKTKPSRQQRVSATSDVTTSTYRLGSSTDDSVVELIRGRVDVVHLSSSAYSDGISRNGDVCVVELEFALVVDDFVHVMGPDREGAWGNGTAEIVVAGILDGYPDIVLSCCEVLDDV